MAFWGAPEEDPHHAKHACKSALRCQQLLAKQNEKWIAKGKEPLPTRIGIHTGEVVVGNLGSTDRLNYTALGDNVNVTSRLEQLNKIYHTRIIVSEACYQLVKNDFVFRKLETVTVKGRQQSLVIYELQGVAQK